jgi:ERF superfamily
MRSLPMPDETQSVQAPAEKPTLAQKINIVSASIAKIKMTGQNTHDNYKYLKIEDVVDAVRKEMQKAQLILTPQILKIDNVPDTKGILRDVDVEWTLEDASTGEKRAYRIPGTGWDYHDKGTYKALTGSRKYALILIFNLPVGDNPEASGAPSFDQGVKAAKGVTRKFMADKANSDDPAIQKIAIDNLSQVEPERKILISRPETANGHYIAVSGLIAVPQLETYFMDTDSKRFQSKTDKSVYWRVPANYEKGLIALCEKLNIEVEG